MSYGVTNEGFILKRLDIIKAEIEASLKDKFGEINVEGDSTFGQIIGIFSSQLSESWEALQEIYYGMHRNEAAGSALDGALQLVGVTRLAATKSKGTAQVAGDEGTVLTAGSQVSVITTGSIFELVTNVEITKDALHKTIVEVKSTDDGVYTIVIDGVDCNFTASSNTLAQIASGLASAIQNSTQVVTDKVLASATDEKVTITIKQEVGVSGEKLELTPSRYFTCEPRYAGSVNTLKIDFDEIYSPVNVQSVDSGAIIAPANSLIVIENPTAGWDKVTNLIAVTQGRETETDAEYRLRGARSLQLIGASTIGAIRSKIEQEVEGVLKAIVVENSTNSIDSENRPPHSIEVIATGGDGQAIAEKIWEVKPAGISTYGSYAYTVMDENGNAQTVQLSRVNNVDIYVAVNYHKYSQEMFPTNGELLIKDAVKNHVDSLDIGEDVISERFKVDVFSKVTGIEYLTIKISKTVSPSSISTITIDSDEVAVTDLTKITVSEI